MTTSEESILVAAEPEQVGGFIEDPLKLLEIQPSMAEVRDVQGLPAGGYEPVSCGLHGCRRPLAAPASGRLVSPIEPGRPGRAGPVTALLAGAAAAPVACALRMHGGAV